MDTVAHRRPLQACRLLLLLLVVFGVTGMHTLGHSDHGHDHAGVLGMTVHTHGGELRATSPGMAESDSAGSTLPDLDPASTCLAVLTSLLLLLLAALGARSRHRPGAPTRTRPWVWCVPRPPPRRIALDLTRVAVLRI